MASISFRNVSKVFENGGVAVDRLNLEIADGEFLVLVGPSGCGKTTSLRMVAGLEDPTDGEILIGDRVVNDIPPRSRDIAMVFQNYALYPHMSVADNLTFALRMQGAPKAERQARARQAAEVLAISDLLERRPKQLSGGQRQRVAMGRAIVREPSAFLMDEPLSNLDAKLRVQMRAEIARIQHQIGTTTLYVTHDQIEAMTMADRVAVMRKGTLQQLATPAELYDRPTNLFVAGFIGSPPMNLYNATIETGERGPQVRFGSHILDLPEGASGSMLSRDVVLGLRAEDVTAPGDGGAVAGRSLEVTVELVEQLGSDLMVHALIDATVPSSSDVRDALDDPLLPPRTQLISRCHPRLRAAPGDRIRLAVDVSRLHLFDAASGERIDAAGGAR